MKKPRCLGQTRVLLTLGLLLMGALFGFSIHRLRSAPERVPAQQSGIEKPLLNAANDLLDSSPASQALFYAHVESEALRFYELHKAQMGKVKHSTWAHIVKKMVAAMQSMKLGLKAVGRFGRPASRVLQATTVVTNILPFILYALDLNALANFVLIVQWEFVVPPLYVVGLGLYKNGIIIHKYGRDNYKKALELRNDLLGMSDSQRLITVLDDAVMSAVEADPNNRWISISRDRLAKPGLLGQNVSLSELESIVAKVEFGPQFILDWGRDPTISKTLYSVELWNLIRSDANALQELRTLLEKRLPNSKPQGLVKLARQLSIARDLKRAVLAKEEDALKLVGSALNFPNSIQERKELKALASEIKAASSSVFASIYDAEFMVLISQVNGSESPIDFDKSLDVGHALYERLHQVKLQLESFSTDRKITAASLRRVLMPSQPNLTARSGDASCRSSLTLFLSTIKI